MSLYDLIVIGAGPAGGSAAFHAAKQGLSVLVLEEHPSVGEPVHCGECLSQLACDRMGWKLPDDAIALPVDGVRVIFPENVETKLTEKGYVLEKHAFETWIIAEAKAQGAQIQLGKKVSSLERNDGIWTLHCADQSAFSAKILIDASGVAGVANRLLNLNPRFESVIGMQYELLDIPTDGYLDFFIWPDLAPHGYLWMIPKNNGRANVGLVTNQNTKAKTFLDEFVKRQGWQAKKNVKAFGGLIPASGPVKNTVADGLMLIGDAAGFTSPLFEGGTHLGLMSGRYAAQTAKKALDQGDTTAVGLNEYETLWKKEFPDYSKLIHGKNALYGFSDAELADMGRFMPNELSNIPIFDKAKFGLNVLTKHPGWLTRGILPALSAFGYSRAEYYGW